MRLLLLIAVAVLAACSRPPEPPAERDTALQKTIEEPQQRAKAVEADLQQAKQRVDAELDAAEAKPPEG
jgi:outer membrane biogenesis lipoprotein LolB